MQKQQPNQSIKRDCVACGLLPLMQNVSHQEIYSGFVNRMKIKCLILFIMPVLSGCSLNWVGVDTEGLYETFQPDMQSCQKVPQSQHSDCVRRVQDNLSYEEYKKIRNEAVNE